MVLNKSSAISFFCEIMGLLRLLLLTTVGFLTVHYAMDFIIHEARNQILSDVFNQNDMMCYPRWLFPVQQQTFPPPVKIYNASTGIPSIWSDNVTVAHYDPLQFTEATSRIAECDPKDPDCSTSIKLYLFCVAKEKTFMADALVLIGPVNMNNALYCLLFYSHLPKLIAVLVASLVTIIGYICSVTV